MNKDKYKQIPSVSRLLEDACIQNIQAPQNIKLQVIREHLQKIRSNISAQDIIYSDIVENIKNTISAQIDGLRRCINATGIILHTGLGRAPISYHTLAKVQQDLAGYINLEIDCNSGKRSHRDEHTKTILTGLTGAEDATIVNNNAAAVLITISAIAKGKEVIVSCGQLVEIGGSFRIPEVIEQSGAKLRVVGCTNKTHLHDYENAINENTAAILYVHTSNYKIVGFSSTPNTYELAQLAKKHSLPLIEDAGSGLISNFSVPLLASEPVIKKSIANGVDVVTFSGDKLLGGCQAGIIVGKEKFISCIRNNPLMRALRVDKFTTLILQQTLRDYQQSSLTTNPVLEMLTRTLLQTQEMAQSISATLQNKLDYDVTVENFPSYTGSGALPATEIESFAVAIRTGNKSLVKVAKKLRLNNPALFTVIKNDTLYIAPRSLLKGECEEVIVILGKLL